MPDPKLSTVDVRRVQGESAIDTDDVLVVEEPLEIRAAWRMGDERREKSISVTMRTPGDDLDLAAGFLFTEGLIQSPDDIDSLRHWSSPNVLRVALRDGAKVDTSKLDRHFYTTSSCGVCGKTSIEALRVVTNHTPKLTHSITGDLVHRLPVKLEEHQAGFRATGALHAAAIFNASGEMLRCREDIGRHNAVDKVVGSLFRERATPLSDTILMVSSRGSFEIVQKAVMAGIPVVASVGAPSTLAVDLAREFGLTLLGFVRNGRFNVYAGSIA
ncbi:MAG TPA: formate dehydrogenase accessory sulfurtransferase FdhD [Thermoanaerobaculia bacterium]|nr:formate dehydrogenase accessory sulfurtransferase FdhD [Thermoanaerobaculia bacterium]